MGVARNGIVSLQIDYFSLCALSLCRRAVWLVLSFLCVSSSCRCSVLLALAENICSVISRLGKLFRAIAFACFHATVGEVVAVTVSIAVTVIVVMARVASVNAQTAHSAQLLLELCFALLWAFLSLFFVRFVTSISCTSCFLLIATV